METNTDTPEAKQPASAGCHPTTCSPVPFSRETPIMNEAMNWADRRDLLATIGNLERQRNGAWALLRRIGTKGAFMDLEGLRITCSDYMARIDVNLPENVNVDAPTPEGGSRMQKRGAK